MASLFDLPPEIRDMIYSYVYPKDGPAELALRKWFLVIRPRRNDYRVQRMRGLLRASKQVRREAAPFYYANAFKVDNHITSATFSALPRILERYAGSFEYIQDLTITLKVTETPQEARKDGKNRSSFWFEIWFRDQELRGRVTETVTDTQAARAGGRRSGHYAAMRYGNCIAVYATFKKILFDWHKGVTVQRLEMTRPGEH